MARKRIVRKYHHLDQRADAIIAAADSVAAAASAAAAAAAAARLLSTVEMARWFGLSEGWFKIGRAYGYGPPFVRVDGAVKYPMARAIKWLNSRSRQRRDVIRRQRGGTEARA